MASIGASYSLEFTRNLPVTATQSIGSGAGVSPVSSRSQAASWLLKRLRSEYDARARCLATAPVQMRHTRRV